MCFNIPKDKILRNDSEFAVRINLFMGIKNYSLKTLIAATLARLNFSSFSDTVYSGESFESVAINVFVDEVRRLITSMPSKCPCLQNHHPLISSLRHCSNSVHVFSDIIARLANLSFSEGIFPTMFKFAAAVTPLLKKLSLDPDNPANYRPISNLNNIYKIIERLFLS